MREPHVDRLLARIPWPLFLEWQGFRALEPFGDERADWRIASLAALIANVNRDRKRRSHPFTAKEFLLRFDSGTPQRRSWQKQKEALFNVLGVNPTTLTRPASSRTARARRKEPQP